MSPRNLTDHQKAVEEAAGMSLDWGMANAATVAQAQSHHHHDELNYERYVDGLRRSNAQMLTALKDIVLWAERHGLTKADLITGGQAEVPVITNARAAIAQAEGGAS